MTRLLIFDTPHPFGIKTFAFHEKKCNRSRRLDLASHVNPRWIIITKLATRMRQEKFLPFGPGKVPKCERSLEGTQPHRYCCHGKGPGHQETDHFEETSLGHWKIGATKSAACELARAISRESGRASEMKFRQPDTRYDTRYNVCHTGRHVARRPVHTLRMARSQSQALGGFSRTGANRLLRPSSASSAPHRFRFGLRPGTEIHESSTNNTNDAESKYAHFPKYGPYCFVNKVQQLARPER